MEKATNKTISKKERSSVVKGASEIDLVNSGLEDTMVEAYQTIREAKKKHKITDLRTAAFYVSIMKIADAYGSMGIFP